VHTIKPLTGIRAIAAILIFTHHARKYWYEKIPLWLNNILLEFHIGVSIFFVLSGFLIAYTYKEKPLKSFTSYLKYAALRVLRIMPIYWMVLVLMYILEGAPSTNKVWLQVTLANAASDSYNLEGIAQAWSLWVELFFYLLAPFCFVLIKRNAWWLVYLCAAFLCIGIIWGYGLYGYNKNPHSIFYPLNFILQGSFWGRALEFLLGVLLAKYCLVNKINNSTGWQFTVLGIVGIAITVGLLVKVQPSSFESSSATIKGICIRNYLLPIAVVVLIYGLIKETNWLSKLLGSNFFVVLGNGSFIFYLIHIGVVNNFINKKLGGFYDRNFVLLYLISIIFYYLIDKPLYAFFKRLFASKKVVVE
jgi:peptidoglycan/LPS O-acetylase OafA/YrhL